MTLYVRFEYPTCVQSFISVHWSVFTACRNAARCIRCSIYIRLSVTRQYCVKTNKDRMMPSSLAVSIMNLVFGDIKFINIFARGHT